MEVYIAALWDSGLHICSSHGRKWNSEQLKKHRHPALKDCKHLKKQPWPLFTEPVFYLIYSLY